MRLWSGSTFGKGGRRGERRHTIASALISNQSQGASFVSHEETREAENKNKKNKKKGTMYAQTCDPCSGITVHRIFSLSRRIQATLPREFNETVNSAEKSVIYQQQIYVAR